MNELIKTDGADILKKNPFLFWISYNTNFKPSILTNFNNFKLFRIRKNNPKILTKNFFIFLLLLKFLKENSFFENVSVVVKPSTKKLFNLLKAPYKNKLARHQFDLVRFNIVYKFSFLSESINIKKNNELFFFLKKIKKFYCWFESNIVYQHRVKFSFFFSHENNFCLSSFKKNNSLIKVN